MTLAAQQQQSTRQHGATPHHGEHSQRPPCLCRVKYDIKIALLAGELDIDGAIAHVRAAGLNGHTEGLVSTLQSLDPWIKRVRNNPNKRGRFIRMTLRKSGARLPQQSDLHD